MTEASKTDDPEKGRPLVIYEVVTYLRRPWTDDEMMEIARFLKSKGALAIDIEGYGGDDPRFALRMAIARDAVKSGEAQTFKPDN